MNLNLNYNKKILPIANPIISSYPYHANLLSVISSTEDYLPWFLSHYIQLCIPNDISIAGARMDYYTSLLWKSCPFLYYQRISRELISNKWNSITDFIIDNININNYVYFIVDTFFIEPYGNYNLEHSIHDIFIYGYDLNEKIFYVADNFKDGFYSYEKARFEQIELGYKNLDMTGKHDWLDGVEFISYRKKTKYFEFFHEYKFDTELVKEFLMDYLLSRATAERHKVSSEQWKYGKDIYGIKVYDGLVSYVKERPFIDIRPFYVLWEHKVIMQLRIKYMAENDMLNKSDLMYDNYTEIRGMAEIIKNIWIKFTITKDENLIEIIIYYINELKIKETNILSLMLENIK